MRPAIQPQAKEDGAADKVMMGLQAVQLRFRNTPEKCNAQFFRQWSEVTAMLRKPTGALAALREDSMDWEVRILTIGHATLNHWELRGRMITWASEAKSQIKARSAEQTKQTKLHYHRWVDSQLRMGAGALHAFTKRTDAPSEEAVYIHRPKSPGTIRREIDVAKKAHDARIEKAKKKSNSASGGVINSAVGEVGKKVRAIRTTICLETACPAGKFVGVSRVNFKIFSTELSGDQSQTGGRNENDIGPHGSETRDESSQPHAKKIRTGGPSKIISLSDDRNLVVNFHACHACPSTRRSRGEACAVCHTEHAPRFCPHCAIENTPGLWCTDCGRRTASRIEPVWQQCACDELQPSWCAEMKGPPFVLHGLSRSHPCSNGQVQSQTCRSHVARAGPEPKG